MSKKPKVSIVMPTYNRAHKIMKPIFSIINQTMRDWELIIVDDFSTDNTEEVLKPLIEKHPIKLLKLHKNYGPSKARNTGMKYACGEYSAFLDSDDAWEKSFLEKLSGLLNRNHEYAMVYCDSQIFDLARKPYYTFTFEPYNFIDLINSQGKIPTGAFMFRTDCWKQLNGFDEGMMRGEDFEWMMRFAEFFDLVRHPEILHFYYRDKDGLIHKTEKNDKVKLAVAKLNHTKTQVRIRRFS